MYLGPSLTVYVALHRLELSVTHRDQVYMFLSCALPVRIEQVARTDFKATAFRPYLLTQFSEA